MDNPELGFVFASTVNRSVTELLRRVLTRARKVWRIALPQEPNWGAHRLAEAATDSENRRSISRNGME